MQKIILILFLLFFQNTFAQTQEEQDLYGNKIWLVVEYSSVKFEFLDSLSQKLGEKRKIDGFWVYYDVKLREISRVKAEEKNSSSKKPSAKKKQSNSTTDYVVQKRNKVIYYEASGKKIREVIRRGDRVVYRDHRGKLIGYKIVGEDGVTTYYDSKNRKTGESKINGQGIRVFTAFKNRITPKFMVEDPYFY